MATQPLLACHPDGLGEIVLRSSDRLWVYTVCLIATGFVLGVVGLAIVMVQEFLGNDFVLRVVRIIVGSLGLGAILLAMGLLLLDIFPKPFE